MPEYPNFRITVAPTLADPHNWCWSVQWTFQGQVRKASGPLATENVISTPGEARQDAQRYADALADNLPQASTYVYVPKVATRA